MKLKIQWDKLNIVMDKTENQIWKGNFQNMEQKYKKIKYQRKSRDMEDKSEGSNFVQLEV